VDTHLEYSQCAPEPQLSIECSVYIKNDDFDINEGHLVSFLTVECVPGQADQGIPFWKVNSWSQFSCKCPLISLKIFPVGFLIHLSTIHLKNI
jgi:hypothetical protein